MSEINAQLISAVDCGQLERLRNLLNLYGLDKSEGHGYVLLRRSIILKHKEITKLLLSSGSRVNSKNSKINPSNTPLHYAVEHNDIELINMLLDNNANINAKNKSALATPLLWAISRDNEEIVDLLLTRGAYLNNYSCTSPVLVAVQNGLYKMTEKLIQLGASVNVTCHTGAEFTPLLFAARLHKGFPIVELLLKHGANMNSKTVEGLTAMHLASEKGHIETIKLLLSGNADVNARSNKSFTPLYLAVRNSQREAAKCLMDGGANINAEFENGRTILNLAVSENLSMIVEDILKYSPDVNNTVNKNSLKIAATKSYGSNLAIVTNLLNYGFAFDDFDVDDINFLMKKAIKGANIEIIQHIIKNGLHFACYKKENCDFLHFAAKYKQVEIAKLFLTHGIDVNASDEAGKCAIYYSTEQSDVIMTKLFLSYGASVQKSPELLRVATTKICKEIVEILLQNEVDIEATDIYGRTALHLTALREYDGLYGSCMKEDESYVKTKGEIAKLLLSMGANVNAVTNKDKLTALHIACKKCFVNVVEVLLEYKADVNLVVKDCLPLMIAAKEGHALIMEMLIANGANVNSKRENGDTALHIVAREDFENIDPLKVLLKNGAHVNSKNNKDATPLHEASRGCKLENISILLEYGCLINSKDINGNTPLHVAVAAERSKVIKLLLNSGSDINILNNKHFTAVEITKYLPTRTRSTLIYDSDDECFDIRSCDDYEHDDLSLILKLHLITLYTANLHVNENNLTCICQYSDESNILHEQNCKDEIEQLKKEKIANNKLSFFDILTKNIHSLASYARNEDIKRVFESDEYKLKFPIYARIIERNFEKGIQRRLMLDQTQEFFKFYFDLPYDCSDHISEYLSDADLENIINVSKPSTTVKDF